MREGAQDVIAKPFTPGLLLEVMNRELDHQRLRREAQRVKNLEEEIRGLTRVRAEMEKLATWESRFMLTMIHVLRVPVAILQNTVRLIRQGYVPPEELPQVLERTELRAEELLATLDDIHLLSRLKQMVDTKATEPVSLADVLDSVRSSFRKEMEERQLTISTEIADRPVLLGNPVHFQLLWSQLLSNAIQYTPRGGRITLSLKTDFHERQVEGTVSDTGIGIATEEIPRIFEVFYRSEAAKSIKETGTGLGLPIVKQIVSLYGGTIEIESTPGEGTSIRFKLPQSTVQSGEVSWSPG